MSAPADLFPVVVRTADGVLLAAAITNEKGYLKSVERNHLWVLHPATARLIPWEHEGAEPPLSTIVRHPAGWVECTLRETTAPDAVSAASRSGAAAVPGAAEAPGADAPSSPPAAPASTAPAAPDTIARLTAIIRERRRTMMEGSYTTHLFAKGPEKIRKKAGEEAIELLLARDTAELVSESADFIYHLLVLLEAHDTSFAAVLDALAARE